MDYITIDRWYGGLSQGSRIGGAEGSFRYGKGLNYKDDPDAITANMALVKDSGSTVTDLVKWIVNDGGVTYFYGDGGKIYKRTSAGSWSLLQTTANSQGQGLEIFSDYLFYTQNSQLGHYGALSGTPSFTDNFKTGLDGTTAWRPLRAFANLLCIGNGRYLATLEESIAGTWTAQKLTFPVGWSVRDLGVQDEYLVIAVNDNADIAKATRGRLIYWDGTSSSYNFCREVVEGGGISSIQANQDSVFVFPGKAGNFYLDVGRVTKVKRIPYIGEGKTIYIYPGADTNHRGLLCFGVAGGTSTTVYRGVYEWGKPEQNYPNSLNFAFPISTGTMQGTGVDVASVKSVGADLFSGWKDGSTYGVDKLSTSTYQTSVVYESLIFSFSKQEAIQRAKLYFETLENGESIALKYKANHQASWQTFDSASYSVDGAVTEKLLSKEFRAGSVEFQITLAGSGTMPVVHKLVVECQPEDLL